MTAAGDGPTPPSLDRVRRFVLQDAEAGFPAVRDSARIPADQVAQLTDLGLLRLTVPVEFGGYGLSSPEYQPYLEVAAQGPAWLRMLTHVANGFWRPLATFGNSEQRALLPRMATGQAFV